jgi:hypothetical protein
MPQYSNDGPTGAFGTFAHRNFADCGITSVRSFAAASAAWRSSSCAIICHPPGKCPSRSDCADSGEPVVPSCATAPPSPPEPRSPVSNRMGSIRKEIFSVQWQVLHSKVRCSKPRSPREIRANPILCLQVGHIGRSAMERELRIPHPSPPPRERAAREYVPAAHRAQNRFKN